MDGKILANSLMTLHGTDLRMVYALLCRTNIGHLLSSKTKDLFSKTEQDHFTLHLMNEVTKLDAVGDDELRVNLLLEITKLLKLRGMKYMLVKEIEDQCQIIVQEVYRQFEKQDKQFRAFTATSKAHIELQQMIIFQMSNVFIELDSSFNQFTVDDQTKFAAQVNEYIHSLPEDKQTLIKEKLGINDLTDDMIRKAIATSGTSIVFAIIVEVSGFAFYTTATSLVAAFAGLFGLTLPFGFYTGLTSTIAVLANPLFILPLLLGGGVLIVKQQNKSLKKKLLPIIIMQIALPYMSSGGADPSFMGFINEWQSRYDEYDRLHTRQRQVRHKRNEAETAANERNSQISLLSNRITSLRGNMVQIKQSIVTQLKEAEITSLSITPAFAEHVLNYMSVLHKLDHLQAAKVNQPQAANFLGKLGRQFKKATLSLDIHEEQKKA